MADGAGDLTAMDFPDPKRDAHRAQTKRFMELLPHVIEAMGLKMIEYKGGTGLSEQNGQKVRALRVSFGLILKNNSNP